MSYGLALGGGGVVGIAWEIGVLAGLEDKGIDVGGAAVVVGTSAGSVVGAQLLLGRTLSDLMAQQREPEGLAAASAGSPDLNALTEIFQLWGGADEMTPELVRQVGELALRAKTAPEEGWVAGFEQLIGTSEWPAGDLRVAAVDCTTGERRVWTAASGVDLQRAVASSCAVPGLFPPVTIGGTRYTDGGVWSGSNADVVSGAGVSAAVFVGPLVGDTGIARVSGRTLERERATLADAGITLVTIVPGPDFRVPDLNLMDPGRREWAVEIGLADGREAAGRVAEAVGG